MRRYLAVLMMCGMVSAAWGQPAPAATKKRTAAPEEGPKVVRLTAVPRDAPDPALRYTLLPPWSQRKAGNPILQYYVARDQRPGQTGKHVDADRGRERSDKIAAYLRMPPGELPKEEVREFLKKYRAMLRQIEIGATRTDPDWDLPVEEGLTMLIPNLSGFRDMARIVALRARLEIAEGRFDDAVRTLQMGLAFGRHVGDRGPTLINALVGIAIETQMLRCVEDLIAADGPNLYWALAALPQPLVDLRAALLYERGWLVRSRPELAKLSRGPIGRAEGEALLRGIVGFYEAGTGKRVGGGPSILAMRYYPVAKQALLRQGRSREEVEAIPVAQVVGSHLWSDYVHWRDELFKWFDVPYWQAHQGMKESARAFGERSRMAGANPLAMLLPSFERVYLVQVKLDRTRAALQVVEAVRAYAARHGGPPESLTALDLPAPVDPITGRPFDYEVDGRSFTLVGPAPEGERAREGVRYEVRLKDAPKEPAEKAAPPAPLPEGPWRGIAPFLDARTLAVAQIDLAALTSDETWKRIAAVLKAAELDEEVLGPLAVGRVLLQQVVRAGAKTAFVVVNVTDMPDVPMIVLPLGESADADTLARMLPMPDKRTRLRRIGGALVLATDAQVRALRGREALPRAGLLEALRASRGAARAAVALSDDMRRALEETLPARLPQWGNQPTTALTRGLRHINASVEVAPELSLRLVAQTRSADAAKALKTLLDRGSAALLGKLPQTELEGVVVRKLTAALVPEVRADQLVLERSEAQMVRLYREILLLPGLREAQDRARRESSASRIHLFLTACHTWANDHGGTYPPDLQALVMAKLVPAAMRVNPRSPDRGQAGYVYLRPSVPLDKLTRTETIVIYEAHEEFGAGVNVGFADGHVEWIADAEQFRRLLGEKEDPE